MPQDDEESESQIGAALELLKAGEVHRARQQLSISPSALTDEEVQQGLIALEQALIMFGQGRQPEARAYFATALPMVEASSNEEIKFEVKTLADFSEGISRLMEGDAHGGQALLSNTERAFERMAF